MLQGGQRITNFYRWGCQAGLPDKPQLGLKVCRRELGEGYRVKGVWPLLSMQVGQAWGMRLEGLLGAGGNEIQGSGQGD